MAYAFTSNTTPATGSLAMYSLIALLIAQGWLKKADADGTTYSATGVQVTGGGTGAHGLGNTNAWVRLQSPGGAGTTELIIQRGTSDSGYRIKISAAAGFTGGSPSGTQAPSATDEFILYGGGTDAAPSYGTIFPTTNNTYRFSCGADSAAPYTFWSGSWIIGGANTTGLFLMDSFTNGPPGDIYKNHFIVANSSTAGAYNGAIAATTSAPTSGQNITTNPKTGAITSADYQPYPGLGLTDMAANNGVVPAGYGGLASDPITSKDDNFPIVCARRVALTPPSGYKGILSMCQWISVPRNKAGETQDISGTRDRIIFDQISLPWDGSIPVM
jgi:hypothetical protein